MDRIVLASASPRRSELLGQAGFEFTVIPSKGEEIITKSHPAEVVEELSLQKAREVAARILDGTEPVKDFRVVIGADTVVAAEHRILGKPGVTLIGKDSEGNVRTSTFHERTDVDVCEMTGEEIEAYIDTREPYDKAGAYGIQGSFGIYIRGIRGCYYNVVGLPISRLYHELKKAGASC